VWFGYRLTDYLLAVRIERAVLFKQPWSHPRIRSDARFAREPLQLAPAGLAHPFSHDSGRLAFRRICQFRQLDRGHSDMNVDPIEP
jgi:hypothetical protein